MSDIILVTFIGIIAVLLVMNASNAAAAITGVSNVVMGETKAITGATVYGN